MWAIVAVLVAGCGSQPKESTGKPGSTERPVPAQWTACQADADCKLVEMGCCDHCNGGWVISVHRDHASAASAAHHEKCAATIEPEGDEYGTSISGTSCTELGCVSRAKCDDGTCGWGRMGGDGFDEYHELPNVLR